MGCNGSTNKASGPAASGNGAAKGKKSQDVGLLEEYSVGATLGEGAYGVVSVCRRRTTGEEFAVKMVDKVETPVEAIKREAEMLKAMEHENIVRCHGIFYERCFVCIVMDKYSGGDLVEGLQRHLKDKGQIDCHHVIHVAKQISASIQYLHQNSVIHRDVKGDNYLMDRKDMTSPECHIALTDFGTAYKMAKPDEVLHASVGTKIFWAPEFFDKRYGLKVDVWAIGVIMYGLVSGRFPFRDENDIRTKVVKVPKRVHSTCEAFILAMLEKKAENRMTADQVMAHDWLKFGRNKAATSETQDDNNDTVDGKELNTEEPNDGIRERRQELLNRLNLEHAFKSQGPGKSSGNRADPLRFKDKKFTVQVPVRGAQAGVSLCMQQVFEWWSEAQVNKGGIISAAGKKETMQDNPEDNLDLNMFKQMLKEHNIDIDKFGTGKAKEIRQMKLEVDSGAARLMLDATSHKKLVRVVDVVVLRMRAGEANRLLVETEEAYKDGRKRETLRLPGTKKEVFENTRQCAERIIKEMFLIDDITAVKFNWQGIEHSEEEVTSPSYPGVQTVYRKEFVNCTVVPEKMGKVGLPEYNNWNAEDRHGQMKYFSWMTDKMAEGKKVQIATEGETPVSTLVRAPIGLTEDALREKLKDMGHDLGKWGCDGTKTMKEFSAELIKGEAALIQDKNGDLCRLVDHVVLIIKNGADEIVVHTTQIAPDGKQTMLNRLPGAKRRPDENQFLSARRILRRQLEIDENQVVLDTAVSVVEEERSAPAYPGLTTVYRKRQITGHTISG